MRLLGIGGGSASGKTSLSMALQRALGAPVLPHDAYYKTLPDAFRGERQREYNFDHPDALDTTLLLAHLDTLASGTTIHVPSYDYTDCRRLDPSTWTPLSPDTWVIVEGILVLAIPELRERFDATVFVDCPGDIRLARRLLRDCVERGDTPGPLVDQYLTTVRPMHELFVQPSSQHADLRLDGRSPLQSSVAAVERLLTAR